MHADEYSALAVGGEVAREGLPCARRGGAHLGAFYHSLGHGLCGVGVAAHHFHVLGIACALAAGAYGDGIYGAGHYAHGSGDDPVVLFEHTVVAEQGCAAREGEALGVGLDVYHGDVIEVVDRREVDAVGRSCGTEHHAVRCAWSRCLAVVGGLDGVVVCHGLVGLGYAFGEGIALYGSGYHDAVGEACHLVCECCGVDVAAVDRAVGSCPCHSHGAFLPRCLHGRRYGDVGAGVDFNLLLGRGAGAVGERHGKFGLAALRQSHAAVLACAPRGGALGYLGAVGIHGVGDVARAFGAGVGECRYVEAHGACEAAAAEVGREVGGSCGSAVLGLRSGYVHAHKLLGAGIAVHERAGACGLVDLIERRLGVVFGCHAPEHTARAAVYHGRRGVVGQQAGVAYERQCAGVAVHLVEACLYAVHGSAGLHHLLVDGVDGAVVVDGNGVPHIVEGAYLACDAVDVVYCAEHIARARCIPQTAENLACERVVGHVGGDKRVVAGRERTRVAPRLGVVCADDDAYAVAAFLHLARVVGAVGFHAAAVRAYFGADEYEGLAFVLGELIQTVVRGGGPRLRVEHTGDDVGQFHVGVGGAGHADVAWRGHLQQIGVAACRVERRAHVELVFGGPFRHRLGRRG